MITPFENFDRKVLLISLADDFLKIDKNLTTIVMLLLLLLLLLCDQTAAL
jgi:hypothetical protein